jgi:hypothetical protein
MGIVQACGMPRSALESAAPRTPHGLVIELTSKRLARYT